ncbi:hypothetical protein DAT35_45050 [Vitiosangium sp. GDMCC 1.1324]|nr:hypothetical protein DAT35_45050 [Vitiosangium sp. GDMCC 1.1324]
MRLTQAAQAARPASGGAGRTPQARLALAEEYAPCAAPSDERVSVAEVVELIRKAAAARNGKSILARCAPASWDVTGWACPSYVALPHFV